ncbi:MULTISPECIES: LysR family transcriptional regulator [Pseudomonas]|uniref:LysR family transcriptional regulator n=1 Tax=Pseudomonas lactis TaxID=1615674 RepID=A0ABS9FNZ4_9PSED|nr:MULTISPECIES: LysR family transcriptional regulator [Pseudomonas]MBI6977489.1 LysR family transcriptional regulator [Pseudomonas lactis]MCF4974394.1 LysR family transcriptional regulator [Pseudomonas lactis]MCF5001610.1 LysR family transcriptional regulator [Pseudomonas lactis]MCF5008632.1 LysR family transcriptional regulator [Pseudomonas lactis]MCF5012406.1 LysR family transcriptional regulator [Pseudomonas lactis]
MSINLPLPLLGEMAIFVKVVETGSFSEAARQLSVSPSAVSRSISRLEHALATRLLQRTTRKLRLSEGGEEVFKRCQEMVNAARSVMEISGQFTHEAEGLVRVSVPKAVGRFVVHPHMPEFLRRYPKVDVQLILEDRHVDLIDDNVDLSIRITDSPPPGLVGRQLLPIEHLLCATPQYLAEHGTPSHPHDLLGHSCIYLGETPGDSRWKFRQAGKAVTVGVRGRYAANHTGVRLEAALQHVGIASLPYFTARHALEAGELVQVLPGWDFIASYHGEAWLLHSPTQYLPPKLRVFIDYLVECMAREPTLHRR